MLINTDVDTEWTGRWVLRVPRIWQKTGSNLNSSNAKVYCENSRVTKVTFR